MRRRRLVTALLAVVLAALGATLLTQYVRGADQRALSGLTTVDVLVVTKLVPSGSAAAGLGGSVTTKALPRLAVAPGTLGSLQDAGDRVTAGILQPGEQLLNSKFVDPASLEEETEEIALPAGLQEVTVSLDRQRMLGSALVPGDRVGVFVSLSAQGETPARTKLAVPKVLVLAIGEPSSEPTPARSEDDAGSDVDEPAPAESVTVRLAVDTEDAEKVVFGAEHGRVWLSRQPDDVPDPSTDPEADAEPDAMTADKVYR
jgi:pilus assembly protein CpaB